MSFLERTIPCAAILACVIGLGNIKTVARPLDGQAVEIDDDRPSERFVVIDHGCALLGADGEEKERLESITSAVGAISPDGRFVLFSKSEVHSPSGKQQADLVSRR